MRVNVCCLLMLGALGVSLTIGCSRADDAARLSAARPGDVAVGKSENANEPAPSWPHDSAGAAAGSAHQRAAASPVAGVNDSDEPDAKRRGSGATPAAALNAFPVQSGQIESKSVPSGQSREHDRDDPNAEIVVPVAKLPELADSLVLDNGRDGGDVLPANGKSPAVNKVQPAAGGSSSPGESLPLEIRPPANSRDAAHPAAQNSTAPAKLVPAAAELPAQFRALDKDNDQQLGVYEWPRDDLDTFQKLDRNGDGFVTPAEWAAGAKDGGPEKSKGNSGT